MKLTNNFSKSEFDCKSGEDMPNDVLENVKQLAVQLQAIRDYVGKPIRINSAYRSKAHNKAIGGVKTSQHILRWLTYPTLCICLSTDKTKTTTRHSKHIVWST